MNRYSWVPAVLIFALAGCVSPLPRFQSAEESERERDLAVRTIGEVTEVANVQPYQVSGVGIVTGLEGTGHSPQGQFRTMLEQQLRKQKIENIKSLLDSPDNALVLVSALIPAGARKGEPLDIEVTLPPGSKATSLRGGSLQDCSLRNYDNTRNLNPETTSSDRLLPGHILARAKGPLLVGLGNPDEPAEQKRARVWGGGVSLIDRPFYLMLKTDEKSARIANAVANHINLMFQDDVRKQQIVQQHARLYMLEDMTDQLNQKSDHTLGHGDMAKAVNKELIHVRVPYAYRFNQERYLRVARLMPLREDPKHQPRYRARLQKMLIDPADTIRAALRLEALGKESIPALKRGLESEFPVVRFASAEALAYLGSTAGVEELSRLAEGKQYAELRLYCLTALASLDEAICRTKLAEMLTMDDAELRCGAFRALRILDAADPRLGGEFLARAFWLHRVAPKSGKLVHFALGKRAEVVLFGDDIFLLPPARILAGSEFTVTAEPADDRCTVTRISVHAGVSRRQCTLRLEDILRTMADLGAQYPDVVDLLRKLEEIRKLDDRQGLNCPVVVNTLPANISVEELSERGRNPNYLRAPTADEKASD